MNSPRCRRAVRDILLRDWDPLGIADKDGLADEYDVYVQELLSLLAREPSVEQLALYLESIEAALGGMSASNRRLRAAWRLLETFRPRKV
jgi:hypothetical protein